MNANNKQVLRVPEPFPGADSLGGSGADFKRPKHICDGGPAFPQPLVDNQGRIDSSNSFGEGGMSLRDYYAAKAMQSQLIFEGCDKENIAAMAYELADAMLSARSKEVA